MCCYICMFVKKKRNKPWFHIKCIYSYLVEESRGWSMALGFNELHREIPCVMLLLLRPCTYFSFVQSVPWKASAFWLKIIACVWPSLANKNQCITHLLNHLPLTFYVCIFQPRAEPWRGKTSSPGVYILFCLVFLTIFCYYYFEHVRRNEIVVKHNRIHGRLQEYNICWVQVR